MVLLPWLWQQVRTKNTYVSHWFKSRVHIRSRLRTLLFSLNDPYIAVLESNHKSSAKPRGSCKSTATITTTRKNMKGDYQLQTKYKTKLNQDKLP